MRPGRARSIARILCGTPPVCALLVIQGLGLLMVPSCQREESPQQAPAIGPVESQVLSTPAIVPTAIPSPPEISGCTRLDVEYTATVLRHFFPNAAQRSVLSPEELQYLQSLKTISVDDPKIIEAIAREVRTGRHFTPPPHTVMSSPPTIYFRCYKGDQRLAAFTVAGSVIIAGKDRWFEYRPFLRSTQFVPPQISALVSRAECAENLWGLMIFLEGYIDEGEGRRTRLPCSQWCDLLLQKNSPHRQEMIKKCWSCHGSGERKCDFAMNVNWDVNSPPDMVVVFDAKPGWNQCGGPELFTFDNYEPRGGLVLLNDHTVRFIRTEEGLKQLRWK
jgi:hypothetical protein